MDTKNIVILFGGCSSEYSVSLESASSVIRHMDKSRYTPVMVGITQSGDWLHFTGAVEKIAADVWNNNADSVPCALLQDRSAQALLVFYENLLKKIKVDAVFPVLHGKNGEDGTVQGLCELAGIPLVGCGTLASALCMDKHRAHMLAKTAGVRVPRSFVIETDFSENLVLESAKDMGYPLFVKPVRAGSSYGITKVPKPGGLPAAIREAFCFDNQVVLEECIPGFEVGCAVMGGTELITGEIDEIKLADGFFNFEEKYNLLTSEIHVPARISARKAEELKHTAKTIYQTFGCWGFARVDMFLTPSGEIVLNEVNTIPGFTAHSRFPNMMRAAGVSIAQIITRAVELALKG